MAQDTLLGFPAHTLPYRCGGFTTLLTVSGRSHIGFCLLLYFGYVFARRTAAERRSMTHTSRMRPKTIAPASGQL